MWVVSALLLHRCLCSHYLPLCCGPAGNFFWYHNSDNSKSAPLISYHRYFFQDAMRFCLTEIKLMYLLEFKISAGEKFKWIMENVWKDCRSQFTADWTIIYGEVDVRWKSGRIPNGRFMARLPACPRAKVSLWDTRRCSIAKENFANTFWLRLSF